MNNERSRGEIKSFSFRRVVVFYKKSIAYDLKHATIEVQPKRRDFTRPSTYLEIDCHLLTSEGRFFFENIYE